MKVLGRHGGSQPLEDLIPDGHTLIRRMRLFLGILVFSRLAGCDIVDVERFVSAHVVDILERKRTAGGFHRDRAARPLGLLLLRFRARTTLRFGVRSEVPIPRRCRCRWIEPWPPESTRTRTAEPARTRAAEP